MSALESGNSAGYTSNASYAPASNAPKPQALPTNEPGSRGLSEMDSGNDFGNASAGGFGGTVRSFLSMHVLTIEQAASAAFDYASRNPDQAKAAAQGAYGFAK